MYLQCNFIPEKNFFKYFNYLSSFYKPVCLSAIADLEEKKRQRNQHGGNLKHYQWNLKCFYS